MTHVGTPVPDASDPDPALSGATSPLLRIGVLASHPIQYQAPIFRALATQADLHVYFAQRITAEQLGREGFGNAFEWDVDLLAGYEHTFLNNRIPDPSPSHFFRSDAPEISEILCHERFDAFVVTGWNLKAYWRAVFTCRRWGIPVLVRGDSQLNTPRSPLRRLAKAGTYPLLLRAFNAFLTVGIRNRDYYQHYGISARKLFQSPHAIDSTAFAQAAAGARASRAEYREEWGMPPDMIILLFVGKFISVKRADDVLRAAALLHDRGHRVGVVMVGTGPLEPELRLLAREVGVPVHFTGFLNQTELPGVYAAADLLLLPSQSETWGLVVNEAMACGCPAVVSNGVGCAPDLIDEGITGAIFPVGDVQALSAAVELMEPRLHHPDTAQALAAKTKDYSAERAARGFVEAAISVQRGTRV